MTAAQGPNTQGVTTTHSTGVHDNNGEKEGIFFSIYRSIE